MVKGIVSLADNLGSIPSAHIVAHTLVLCTLQPELSCQRRAVLFIYFYYFFNRKSMLVLKLSLNAGVTGVCLAQFTNFLLLAFSCLPV